MTAQWEESGDHIKGNFYEPLLMDDLSQVGIGVDGIFLNLGEIDWVSSWGR